MQQIDAFRPTATARLVSVVLAGFGIFILATIVTDMARTIRHTPSVVGLIFTLVFYAVGFLLSGWWLRTAWVGWHTLSARSIRTMCAASVTLATLCLLPIVSKLTFRASSPTIEGLRNELVGLFGISVAVCIHFVLSRTLVARLGLRDERSTLEQINSVKRSLGLLAHLWWTSGVCVALELVPKEHGYDHVPKEPWDFVALLGPILLSGIAYKIGVRILAPPNEKSVQPPASESGSQFTSPGWDPIRLDATTPPPSQT